MLWELVSPVGFPVSTNDSSDGTSERDGTERVGVEVENAILFLL